MTTRSYWHETDGMPSYTDHQRPASGETVQTECCIIGGGIVGSSAGWHLARRGIPAVVVDMREPGLGASGRNAGMIVSTVAGTYLQDIRAFGHERARALKNLAVENRERLIDLAVRFNVPMWRCGFIYMADNEEEYAHMEENARQLLADGFPTYFHAADPLKRGFLGGLESPEEAVTHPARLTRTILKASGQRLLPYTRVDRIEEGGGDRLRVICDTVVIECRAVLVATNAYTGRLLPHFTELIKPCRGQIQVSESVPMVINRGMGSQNGFYYYRQIPDPARPGYGRWLMGGGRNVNFAAENGHFHEQTTADVQAALNRYTHQYFPELAKAKIEYRWAGTMGFTLNNLPIITPVPNLPQVVACAGFSGHGMGLGHIAALKAIELLIDQQPSWPF